VAFLQECMPLVPRGRRVGGMMEGVSREKMAQGLPQPRLAWQDRLATGALILCVISPTSWTIAAPWSKPRPSVISANAGIQGGAGTCACFPAPFCDVEHALDTIRTRIPDFRPEKHRDAIRWSGGRGHTGGHHRPASAQSSAYSMPLCGGMRRRARSPRMWTNVLKKPPPG